MRSSSVLTVMPGKSLTKPSTRAFSWSMDCLSYIRPERHTSRPTTAASMLVMPERTRKSRTSAPICAVEYDTCVTMRAGSNSFAVSARRNVSTLAVEPARTTLSPTMEIPISGSSENIRLSTSQYDGTTVTRSRSTETETTRSSSFRESFADGLSDSSDETAHGAELRFDRTLWRGERFGVDVGIGWAWFGDIDVFSIRGRAYSGSAATRAVTRSTATDTVTTRTESGTVVTKLSQPEFANADDIRNRDGSIGGAYVAGGDLPDGYQAPVLVVTSDRFSTETRRDAATTTTKTTSGGTKTSSTSSSTTRTVDVRSEGTLSLQEVRAGFQPFWKVSDWLLFRADFGVIATYSELETRTELSVDGVRAGVVERDEHDWTLAGYAGGGISVAVGRHVELFANAEARFPDKSLHFGDGIASGTIDLAQWSASAGVCVRF